MEAKSPAPIIVDLGKQRRSKIKQLKNGYGPLMDQIRSTVQVEKDGASSVPVVILYEKKAKRRVRVPLFGPL